MATRPTTEQLEAARRFFGWPMTVLELLADPVRSRLLTARAKAEANASRQRLQRAVPLPWRRSGAYDHKAAAAGDRDE